MKKGDRYLSISPQKEDDVDGNEPWMQAKDFFGHIFSKPIEKFRCEIWGKTLFSVKLKECFDFQARFLS